MRSALWFVLVLVLLVAACSGPTPAPAPAAEGPALVTGALVGTGRATVPRLDWRPCGTFQCATLTAPMDYRNPTGPTIALDVTRLPALDPTSRIGTVAVNYGGPGTPGTTSLRRLAGRFDGVRARLDVLALQPRGVDQVRCGPYDGEPAQPVGSPLSDPAGFWTSARAIGQACRAGTGELLGHLSTANAARDLDLLRQALGEATISVYGYSYGTYLGATYANLFPGQLRALVVDGALDLVANAGTDDPTRPVDVRAHVAAAREEALDAFVAACAAAGPRCAANPDPGARVAAAVGAATRAGTSAQLAARVGTALESGGRLTGLARAFPTSGPVPPVPDLAAGAPPHSTDFLAVQCTDVVTPSAEQTTALLPAEQAAHPLFGVPVALNTAACVDWPAIDPDRYLGPWNAPLPAPALVVNSRYDPETPLANARATAAQLSAARLLVVDGFGHTTLDLPSRCATDAAAAYLLDPTRLPAEWTVCPPDPGGVPFA
ncbi:alpha/beta hydrolase [Actinomycetospora corticicola]|uniref:Pimeloyl-ACP methyl ester carboxylesterase n=1 Tax=Actinomycetospora corticicola TaxID=663602 RepID=A0A7Y9DZQ2_9PSEU|nr:alpha/beta hydrolase [Actinomycetospora corticicola]NYD38355.1 pimeloyl-ACP methyl ester carboxylesterase [Actinomycetospora corticicola]